MMDVGIRRIRSAAYRIPTEMPESDGTCAWDSTTIVTVEIDAGNQTGFGYSYTDEVAAGLVASRLAPLANGRDALDIEAVWRAMVADVRNIGRPGIASCAISAVDNALWDLKAKLLGLPLVRLLGQIRDSVEVYGSGGFTSYDEARLEEQLGGWASHGFRMVKMKVGRDLTRDAARVAAARKAVGDGCSLFVDANGAWPRPVALEMAHRFAAEDVRWLEEPVSSDDLEGLRWIRERVPPGMAVTAGEYGYDPWYLHRMIGAEAVDVLQVDATRCLGITGMIKTAASCEAANVPLSTHTAPSVHLHAACALAPVVHMEYFHDHVRIEESLFEGFVGAAAGSLRPDASRPGHGIRFRAADAEQWRIPGSGGER